MVSGAVRLARFKVIDPDHGQNGYCGLPITVNAGWIALAVFVSETHLLNEKWCNLSRGPVAAVVWVASLAMVLLQVSRVHYEKPTKGLLFFTLCCLAVALLFLRENVAVAGAIGMMVYGFVYTFITPLMPHQVVLVEDEEEQSTLGHP